MIPDPSWTVSSTAQDATPKDLEGLWTRDLLITATRRVTSAEVDVSWMQVGSLYVDLRQPLRVDPPDCGIPTASSPDDPTAKTVAFGGTLTQDPQAHHIYTWHREVEWERSNAAFVDQGALHFEDGFLIERGTHDRYIERWRRAPADTTVKAAFRASDCRTSSSIMLLRVGGEFSLARLDRSSCLDPSADVSFGSIEGGSWRITRSTDPNRIGGLIDGGTLASQARASWRVDLLLNAEELPADLVRVSTLEKPCVDRRA